MSKLAVNAIMVGKAAEVEKKGAEQPGPGDVAEAAGLLAASEVDEQGNLEVVRQVFAGLYMCSFGTLLGPVPQATAPCT